MLLHATGVVRDGAAALLTGPSGVGKSDLALRLIDRGWRLLADDQVRLEIDGGLVACAPDTTRGLIEVRGVGIERLDAVERAPVALTVALGVQAERLPEPAFRALLGIDVLLFALDPRHASAAIKLEYAFARARAALRRANL